MCVGEENPQIWQPGAVLACRKLSSGAAEAGFGRIGILGKPALIFDSDLLRPLKLQCDGAETRAGDIVLFSNPSACVPQEASIHCSLVDLS